MKTLASKYSASLHGPVRLEGRCPFQPYKNRCDSPNKAAEVRTGLLP
ncbi:MAG: hypothetical protein JXR23_00545 [Pontiellaceae bacterium]|nr:hypothetical protein [Pontiellaceae bacterium]